MKSLIILWTKVADELATICRTSTTQDIKTVLRRSETEGFSFLTITLPNFAKDFERSLDAGFVGSSAFLGFKRRGGLPLFLGGFLELVFDRSSGRLLEHASAEAVYAVRQLCYLFSKIALPCTPAREYSAIKKYVECETEVMENDQRVSDEALDAFGRVGHLLFGNIFNSLEQKIAQGELLPKHGPGATADRLRGNAKFNQVEWTERLEKHFPFSEYAIPNWRYMYLQDRVNFREPGAERPVRVITVPKTLKTPRIIAIEPTCMQYTQQALLQPLVSLLEGNESHRYFADGINVVQGMIGFTDQSPNQVMAWLGSSDGSLASLDLSEASDRVSNLHVMYLLERFPLLLGAIQSCRSMKADVPGHGVVHLSKFASMGSALCFPFEAMVFLTIIFMAVEQKLNRQLTRKDIMSYAGKVRVYGDDIIVPVDVVQDVTRLLTCFGHVVNKGKSFWTGRFRESCGREFFAGEDVSVIRVRMELPRSHRDVHEVLSLVALRNNAYWHGLWKTARYLDGEIGKVLPYYPTVHSTSPVVGRHSLLPYQVDRVCPTHHKPLVKGYVVRALPRDSKASGESALLKWFLKNSEQPFEDPRHLERHGRPDVVGIKLRSASPY